MHVSLRAGVETLIMALAVYYAWNMTAWGVNWLAPDRIAVRIALVALTFASLLMSVAIGDAFADLAWLFVVGYLALQVGRSAFLILALRGRTQGEHFVNVLVWELLGAPFWVAGAIAGPHARLVWWALAVLVAYSGAWTLHWLPGRGRRTDIRHSEVAAGHLVERFRLFFLIMLGEAVLTTGSAFTGEPFEVTRLLALAIGFAGSVALWWCYFERAERAGVDWAETDGGAGTAGWWGTLTLALIVLALIAIAVGDELAVGEPGDDVTLGFAVLAFGGPMLFLAAQMLFLHAALGEVPRSRPLALVALALLALATAPLTLLAGIAATSAVLVAVAVADTRQPSSTA